MTQQPHRQQAAEGRAQGITGGLQADRQPTPTLAGIFTGDDITAGKNAADAQPGQAAQQRQLQRALAQRRKQHTDARQGKAKQDQRATAKAVGPGGDKQRTGSHAEQASTEQQADLRPSQAPLC
ncbi:hypothetical protein D3C78_739340 [compost metagenome]